MEFDKNKIDCMYYYTSRFEIYKGSIQNKRCTKKLEQGGRGGVRTTNPKVQNSKFGLFDISGGH